MPFNKIAKTVTKAFFRKPATLMYPVIPRQYPEAFRGNIEIEIDQCIFCGLCQRRCPADAIAVSKPDKCWKIDRLRCVMCENCVDVCPKKCLRSENAYTAPGTSGEKERFNDARVSNHMQDS